MSPPRGVRIRKEDIPGFPVSTVITDPWDFGDQDQIAKLYTQMQVELAKHETVVSLDDMGNHLTEMLRERQEIEMLKVPLLVEKALEHLEEGKSVVIFVNFRATVAALEARMQGIPKCVIQGVQGKQAIEERIEGIAKFNAGTVKLCLANSAAGGVGISLHDLTGKHPRVTLISPTFDAVVLKQVLGRTPRNGGGNVLQYFAVAADTIEMAVLKSSLKKIAQIDLLNDGAGLTYPTSTNMTPIPSGSPLLTQHPPTVLNPSQTRQAALSPASVGVGEGDSSCGPVATSSPAPLHNPAPTDGSGVPGVGGSEALLSDFDGGTGADDEKQVAEATVSVGGSLSSAQMAGADFQGEGRPMDGRESHKLEVAGSTPAPPTTSTHAHPTPDDGKKPQAPGAQPGAPDGIQGGQEMPVLPGEPSGLPGLPPPEPPWESLHGDTALYTYGLDVAYPGGDRQVRTAVLELPPQAALDAGGREPVVNNQSEGVGANPAELTSSLGVTVAPPVTSEGGVKAGAVSGPKPHAKHGPSGLKLKERCPQFQNTDGENPIQLSGTRMHDALERDDDTHLVDASEEEYVAACRRIIRAKIAKHAQGRGLAAEHKEIQLNMDLGDGIKTFGTCDRLDIFEGWMDAVMMDYKFGFWPIDEPEDNPQTLAYVLGAFQAYPRLSKIEFYFLVPRRDEILHGTFYREQMPDIVRRLRRIIDAADDPCSPERPGDALCQFCAKSASCVAFGNYSIELANKYDKKLKLPKRVHGSEISDPVVLSELLKMAPALEAAIAGHKKKAKELLLAGVHIPGFKIQNRAGVRGVTSAQAVWELVKDRLSPEKFAACADLSLPEVLKAYGDTFPRGQKGTAAQVLEDLLTDRGILERKDPSPTTVRDHRGPKTPSVKQLN